VVLCRDCHRVYHQSCLKEELHEHIGFVCSWCKIFQTIAAEYDKAGHRAKQQNCTGIRWMVDLLIEGYCNDSYNIG
jgi:hypothetical protein